MASFVDSNLEHYELMSTHFATAKGYDAYAKKSELARSAGRDGLVNALLQVAVRGTPEQVLRAYEARRELLGDFELNSSFRFGGIPLGEGGGLDAAVREGGAAGAQELETRGAGRGCRVERECRLNRCGSRLTRPSRADRANRRWVGRGPVIASGPKRSPAIPVLHCVMALPRRFAPRDGGAKPHDESGNAEAAFGAPDKPGCTKSI